MSMIQSDLLLGQEGGAGYTISRSLRFNSSDSAYLSRVVSSAGNRKTFTLSWWLKRSGLTTFQSLFNSFTDVNNRTAINFDSSIGSGGSGDYLTMFNVSGGSLTSIFQTNALFRDASAWYHIVVAVDTTQATSTDRVKLWVNNTLQSFSTYNAPAQNADLHWNSGTTHYFGVYGGSPGTTSYGFNGLLADVFFIDGQALDPSSFVVTSATTGQLIPKAYSGSFGTNGFWLKFSDNSAATATTLGKDYSGNNNNWTPNNLSVTAGAGNDSLTDTPTSYGTDTGAGGEVRGNYCTWNPLDTAGKTLSNGNLDGTNNSNGISKGTIAASSGKWYWEVTVTSSSGGYSSIGIAEVSAASSSAYLGSSASTWSYYQFNGQIYTNGSGTSYGASYTTGDVIGVALDLDNDRVTFYKNGVSQGIAATNLTGTYVPAWGNDQSGPAISANFGQRSWAYAAPAGFKALVDTNLPSPVVAKSSTVMDVKLYTGNGGTQTISGLGFSPDLVWLKCRSAANTHALVDSVRGVTKYLVSAATDAEVTDSGGITSLNSDGFSLTFPTSAAPTINANNATYVAWCFDAGSNTVSNTAGSITSSCRTNQSSGFSIVSWNANNAANQSIGHGLNVTPAFIIHKNRTSASNWNCWFTGFTSDEYINLNGTGAKANTGGNLWYQTPTSSVFYIGFTGSAINNGTDSIISYCFAPVTGLSSFGVYQGNGSSDGPFVFCNFRPRWLLIKRTDAANNSWRIYDTARDPYNQAGIELYPNDSSAEYNGFGIDFLSNGFKLRNSSYPNASGGTFLYCAFAESPFAYSRAR